MLKVVRILLVLWLALSIIGAVIEGLFWLTVVGLVLLVSTAVYGYLKHRQGQKALSRARAIAVSGTARNAPRMPPTAAPAEMVEIVTTGCGSSAAPNTRGWTTSPLICCTTIARPHDGELHERPLVNQRDDRGQGAGDDRTMKGRNAPTKVSTARGTTSGTLRSSRPAARLTASTSTTIAVPRM
jgi:hypothetical protein